MIVECIQDSVRKISSQVVRDRLCESIHLDGSIDGLVVGQKYPVIAIKRWIDGGLWIYLHAIHDQEYPYPYPFELFQIINPVLPKGWHLDIQPSDRGFEINGVGFQDWLIDDSFYERLIDGDQEAATIYRHQRDLLTEG